MGLPIGLNMFEPLVMMMRCRCCCFSPLGVPSISTLSRESAVLKIPFREAQNPGTLEADISLSRDPSF